MKLDRIEQDEFLKALLTKEQNPVLPPDFTLKLLAKVEQEAAIKARIYEPLISGRVWRRIAFAIGALFILQLTIVFVGLIIWPQPENSLLFREQQTSLPFVTYLNAYLAYLPKLLVVVALCAVLWLAEIVQKYIAHRHNSY